jgi:SnoaL-like domain
MATRAAYILAAMIVGHWNFRSEEEKYPNTEEVHVADESKVLETVRRYFEFVGADVERAEEIYHDDAILEFPQSGERFEGVATFTEWRRHYPADPAQMRFRIRRVTARLDLAVVELTATYDGTSWLQGVQLLEFRGDKVARERIYVMDAWEAPEWRAPWRADTPADPPEEISPI